MYNHLRHRRQGLVFDRPRTKAKMPKMKSITSLELPQIYTKQIRFKIPEVCIDQPLEIRKQISKLISFRKDRISCLQPSFFERIPQKVKSLSYQSEEYRQKLTSINSILQSCNLKVREKEVLLVKGLQSSALYAIFANFGYQLESICCEQTAVLKCVQKEGIENEDSRKSQKWMFVCLGCLRILLKINDSHQYKHLKSDQTHLGKRKLLDFALHIASGRYKKHLLQQDPSTASFSHIKSRFKSFVPKKATQSLQ